MLHIYSCEITIVINWNETDESLTSELLGTPIIPDNEKKDETDDNDANSADNADDSANDGTWHRSSFGCNQHNTPVTGTCSWFWQVYSVYVTDENYYLQQ